MALRFYNEDCNYRLGEKRRIRSWILAAIEEEGFRAGDISYIFCSPRHHIGINRQYLGHDYNTDVITFDYSDLTDTCIVCGDSAFRHTGEAGAPQHTRSQRCERAGTVSGDSASRHTGEAGASQHTLSPLCEEAGTVSGDIFIDPVTVASNAAQYGTTPREEMLRVLVHGVLHLCGYKDKTAAQQKQMRAKEDHYLAKY